MRDATDQQIPGFIALTPDELAPENHPVRRIESLARPTPPISLALPPRMDTTVGKPSVPIPAAPAA